MTNIVLLLFILLLVFAVSGVTLFGKIIPSRFGDLPTALFSLFICVTQDGWVDIYSQFQVCRCQKSLSRRTAGWTSTVSSKCVAVESLCHTGRLGGHLQSVPGVSLSKVCVTQDGWVDIYSQFQVCRCRKSVSRRTAGWTSTVSSRWVAVESLCHAGRLGGHLQAVQCVSL